MAAGTAGLVALTADRDAGSAAASSAPYAAGTAQYAAAHWAVGAVGTRHVVACDVTECALLHSMGFPATSLVAVRSGISDLEQADVVVSTPLLRREFGAGLDALVSTEPLAVFGAGSGRVQIDAIALDGPADYARRLGADRSERRTAGAELLTNSRLRLSQAARSELAAGLVDNRTCALLALLSDSGSLSVTAFTSPGPGAGPDIPWPGVVISTYSGDPVPGTRQAATRLRTIAESQQSPFAPMQITDVGTSAAPSTPAPAEVLQTPQPALEVLFAEPAPLELLTGSGT
ncbi:hypothetical protein KDL01_15380 [Actinospica durhamensis]|uniref:Uncharacterized protein n=1 Tax=Actinospica durhamensis TaxID=1508375 RepID=A0A941EP33_9ACTN|nr:hypothetical protein [Actinospica durhamensis]MBR7834655.1 hypothetical protein [Actinospica durhamensis]